MKLPARALVQMADQDQARITAQLEGVTRWEMVHEGDGSSGRIKLTRTSRPSVLYRGQNRHYDRCWPSLCRPFRENCHHIADLDPMDHAHLLRGLALNAWFADELRQHPMIQWADTQHIVIDDAAIAQHYGIPTGYIDASESFEVSAFFATCRYVPASSSWEPMTDGDGVMYRVQVDALGDRAKPICYQPFPRPSQQWAWTIELLLGEDFLQAPMLQGFRFDHDARVGEEFLRRFNGGHKLLPPDPTARLALSMCAAKEIPIDHVEWAEREISEDPAGISSSELSSIRRLLIEELGVGVSGTCAVTYSAQELNAAELEWTKYRDEFYRGVGFRFVRVAK